MGREYLGAAASVANDLTRVVESALAPASSAEVGPRSTASTTYNSASTGVSITGTYPASGRLMVAVSAIVYNNTANFGLMSFEIRDTNSAGTIRRASTDVGALANTGTGLVAGSGVVVVTGLPTSGTMFVRPMFRSSNAANTASFQNISLDIIPQH